MDPIHPGKQYDARHAWASGSDGGPWQGPWMEPIQPHKMSFKNLQRKYFLWVEVTESSGGHQVNVATP